MDENKSKYIQSKLQKNIKNNKHYTNNLTISFTFVNLLFYILIIIIIVKIDMQKLCGSVLKIS